MSLTGHWNASLLPRGIERGGRLKSMHSGATMVHGDGYSNVNTAYTNRVQLTGLLTKTAVIGGYPVRRKGI